DMENREKTTSSRLTESWLTRCQRFKGRSPIEYLFDRLDMLYPSRWRGQFKSPDDHEHWCQCWAEALDERNVTFDEVKQGLARCIEFYNWPPSFPEFMKACRPSVNAEVAFYEAIKQMQLREKGLDQWSSPIVYWAAMILGRDLMNHGYGQIRIRWECALN